MKFNKSLLIAALSLLAASGLFAKDKAKKEEVPGVAPQPAEFFYTGKPYDADLGAYTFNFRNYDPELKRWTCADPSGFPDGVNNQIMVNNDVVNSLDPLGLLQLNTKQFVKVITLTESGVSFKANEYSVKTNDGQASITLYIPINPPTSIPTGGAPLRVDCTCNCIGYAFAGGAGWIDTSFVSTIIAHDGYTIVTGNDYSKSRVAVYQGGTHAAIVSTPNSNINNVSVTGKDGIQLPQTTSPAGQGNYGSPVFYE